MFPKAGPRRIVASTSCFRLWGPMFDGTVVACSNVFEEVVEYPVLSLCASCPYHKPSTVHAPAILCRSFQGFTARILDHPL